MSSRRARIAFGEVLPLQYGVGKGAADTLDKGVDEGIVVSAAHTLVPPAEIERIGKESGVVRTGIQHNREGFAGWIPAQSV